MGLRAWKLANHSETYYVILLTVCRAVVKGPCYAKPMRGFFEAKKHGEMCNTTL